MLDHKGRRAPELSGDSEALQQAGGEYARRRNESNDGIGRHEGHHGCADYHQLDRERQRCFAAGAVSIGARTMAPTGRAT